MSAATSTKKTMDRSAATSTTECRRWAKMPRNGATSGSVMLQIAAEKGWIRVGSKGA